MTPKLGARFPSTTQNDFKKRTLSPGAVFRIKVTDTKPPKTKRILVLAIDKEVVSVGSLYINTEINGRVLRTHELQRLQMPLAAEGRVYLDHDSFLDCSQLHELPLMELQRLYDSNIEAYLGHMSTEDLAHAKKLAGNARTIEEKLKRKYGLKR